MLGKQSKILTDKQVKMMLNHLSLTRMNVRNQVIFLLSVKSGLRSKEISGIKWKMVVDSEGNIGNSIHLTDNVSKGKSGRVIPMNPQLKEKLYPYLSFLWLLENTHEIRCLFLWNFAYQCIHYDP